MDENLYRSYIKRLYRVSVEKVCRFCARKKTRRSVISADPSKLLLLAKLFTQVTQLQLITNTDYPDYICNTCEKALKTTADCMSAFKEADTFWRMYFQRKKEADDKSGYLRGDFQLSEESHSNNFDNEHMDTCSESEAQPPAKIHADESFLPNTKIEKENIIIESGTGNDQPLTRAYNLEYPIEEVILGDIEIKIEKPDLDANVNVPKAMPINNETNEKTEGSLVEELQKLECCNCGEKFDEKSALTAHINLYHQHNLCIECGVQFADARAFSVHNKERHKRKNKNIVSVNGMFSCTKCNKLFKNSGVCRRHLHIQHKETVFFCCKCRSSFFNVSRLRCHMDEMHSNKPAMRCDICNKFFLTRKQIVSHMREHMKLSFVCEICGWKLMSLSGMRLHQLHHTREKKKKVKQTVRPITQIGHLPCPLCPLAFIRGAALREHLKDKHTVEGPKKWEELVLRMCIKCDEIFASEEELKTHRVTHNKFKCTVCKLYLTSKDALSYHMQTHPKKERPHACQLCPATYTMRNHLNSHMRCVHTTVRPHVCNICEKTFAEKYILDKHVRSVHLRERNYPCDKCDKKYHRKTDLTTHYQCHTGIYRYRCKICNKNYGNSSMLFSHNKYHHSNE